MMFVHTLNHYSWFQLVRLIHAAYEPERLIVSDDIIHTGMQRLPPECDPSERIERARGLRCSGWGVSLFEDHGAPRLWRLVRGAPPWWDETRMLLGADAFW